MQLALSLKKDDLKTKGRTQSSAFVLPFLRIETLTFQCSGQPLIGV